MKTLPNDVAFAQPGLTKREYFAAMAMQGFMANTTALDAITRANKSVESADALIEALNKEEG